MKSFLTRIELHEDENGNEGDYTALHKAMEKAGFSRSLRNNKGAYLRLPTAEYAYSTNDEAASVESVEAMAAKAAASVWKNYSTLTVQFHGWWSRNLKTA